MSSLTASKKNSSPSQAKLRIISGPDKGSSFRMISDQASIGRSLGENDIVLQDPYCSRRHAVIFKKENGHYVIQKFSKNSPLLLNKKEVQKPRQLRNKDILTIGQNQIRFELLKGEKVKDLPSLRQDSQALALFHQKAASKRKNPRNTSFFRLILIIIIFGAGYLFLSDQKSSLKKQEGIRIRTNQNIQDDIKEIDRLKKQASEEKKLMKDKSYKNAQTAYLRGIRDYRQGLFGRARENFRVCQTLYPQHKLCSGYLKKAQIKYEKLVQQNMILGKQYRDQNQFRQCRAAFGTVVTMTSYNPKHPLYLEARRNRDFCQLQLEERY